MKPTLKFFLGVFLVAPMFVGTFVPATSHAQALPHNIPVNPDRLMTPGEICRKGEATERRYPEQIYYCARKVDTQMKEAAYAVYDRKYGLTAKGYKRVQFKIDHLVSLCMGGSNDITNLWPQHLTVSAKTDRIENLLCIMMAQAKMRQAQAIDMLMKAKMNLELAPAIEAQLIEETRRP